MKTSTSSRSTSSLNASSSHPSSHPSSSTSLLNTASMIETSRHLKIVSVCVACLIVVVLGGVYGCRWVQGAYRPSGACHTSGQIAQEALRVATPLRSNVRLLSPPVLNVQRGPYPQKRANSRAFWIVLCAAGNQQMNMEFDDKTGSLICLIMDRPSVREAHNAPRLKTQAEAVRVGVERLRTLHVLPSGARIALQSLPHRENKNEFWSMTWLVKTPTVRQPYQIRLRLDCRLGLPTSMADLQQRG